MTEHFSARALLRRCPALGAAAVLVLSVAGCGAEEQPQADDQPDSTDSSPAAADEQAQADDQADSTDSSSTASDEGSGGEFCEAVVGIEDDLSLADMTADWEADPQGYAAQLSAAADRFAEVEPPEEIVEPWQGLSEFFSMSAAALDGVDVTDADALREALKFEGEEAFTMVLVLPGLGETVGAFVQGECGVDLGIEPPVIADVCNALDPAHLDSVFEDATPEGENRRWGAGVVECMWDDNEGAEVGIVVGPADMVRPDVLQDMEPIDAVQTDGGSIDVYDGAVGPLRAAAGRTAVTDVAGSTVVASVRTGDMSADASKAIALTGLIAADLG